MDLPKVIQAWYCRPSVPQQHTRRSTRLAGPPVSGRDLNSAGIYFEKPYERESSDRST
jgi:hypothetical protein